MKRFLKWETIELQTVAAISAATVVCQSAVEFYAINSKFFVRSHLGYSMFGSFDDVCRIDG